MKELEGDIPSNVPGQEDKSTSDQTQPEQPKPRKPWQRRFNGPLTPKDTSRELRFQKDRKKLGYES
jgi:hypothetical protein